MTLKQAIIEASPTERQIVKAKQNEDTFKKLVLVSAIFLTIGIVYFISDILTDLYASKYGMINLAGVLILILSSGLIISCLSYLKERSYSFIFYAAGAYYVAIISVMLLFLSSDLLSARPSYLIVFYNFLLINLIIFYNDRLSIISEILTVIAVYLVLGFLCKTDIAGAYLQSSIIMFASIIVQHYLRIVKTKALFQQVRLESISKESEISATIDFLTKLSNRKGLDIFINTKVVDAINNNLGISITMIDIDDFKSYNDFYSHISGDNCLRRIGHELERLSNDKFHAFRFGGEEFLVIGIGCSEAEAREFSFSILNGVYDIGIDRQDVSSVSSVITVSIGSVFKECESLNDFMRMLKLADDKLYESKRDGKNRITFG